MSFEDKVETWFGQLLGLGDNSTSNHRRTRDKIDTLEVLLRTMVRNQEDLMGTVKDMLDLVRKNASLSGSIVDAMKARDEQIKTLIAQKGMDPESQALLDQAINELQATDTQLAAAAIAGTPAQPTNLPDQQVKNDGPTDAQKKPDSTGQVPATQGGDTAGVNGPGPDQPANKASDAK